MKERISMDELKDATKIIEDAPQEIEVDLKDIESINGTELGKDAATAAVAKKGLSADAKEWIKDILCAVIIAVIILQFVMPTVVREHSMENTLQENDYLFVSKQAYKLFGGTPSRGDVIVFQSNLPLTAKSNKLLVKRIIGVAGDKIAIKDGVTYINGKPIDESFTKDGYTLGDMDEVTVPENCLFCMGDNRQNSGDSRDSRIGFVDVSTIKGKVVFRLFPFKSIGKIAQADITGQLEQ